MWNSLLGEQGLLTALETPDKILKRDRGNAKNNLNPVK
ncbi:MAG: hypothetical protein HW386_787 [Gammaproteobacteria bacterium]|nr:hypothetical protein [Gammaproteobacteria bacterium]